MDTRVLFKKGKQKKFFNLVINKLGCISLMGIMQFGLSVKYNSLKNYYTERRLIPKMLFEDLCYLAKIKKTNFKVKYLDSNWGQIKGGKLGKR
ncbi:MAG: hypothetical protein ACP5OG_05005 [Candidatus Nanoarchaeia archaeon]